MYFADYHMHSTCSPDGNLTMAELAKSALEKGLNEICITDHVDTIRWFTFEPRTDFDWEKARRQYEEAQQLYGDRLTIRLGAELGEAALGFDRAEILLQNAPALDFVIGSVHNASEKLGFFDFCFIEKGDDTYYNAYIEDYLTETRKLVQWGKFNVLGHLTLPLRYIKNNAGLDMTFDKWMDRIEDIFSVMIPKGIGLELNTNRGGGPLPALNILRRYREMGGEILTFGSDAHTADYIGYQISQYQQRLKDDGWRYFTTFEKGKPIFHTL
jgi:histidinol-phosphatase (PHP family)